VTGCKIFNRYKESGLNGLNNQSRAALPASQQVTLPDREDHSRDHEREF
jgi:hypothetical protein